MFTELFLLMYVRYKRAVKIKLHAHTYIRSLPTKAINKMIFDSDEIITSGRFLVSSAWVII